MPDYFEETRKVNSIDLDLNGELSVPTVSQWMQYLATVRSHIYGYDRDTFTKNNNAFWIVSKIRMSFKKTLRGGDEITLKTWPLKPGMLIMPRNFEFLSSDGDTAVCASSEWCVLDMDTHRPRRVSSTTIDTSDDYLTNAVDVGEFSRLKFAVDETHKNHDRVIRSTDIDENGHTNNCIYTRIVMDCFTTEFLSKNRVRTLELHFLSETVAGDCLAVYSMECGDNAYYIEAETDGKKVIKALVEFEEK